jgi:thiol-disulfide isomerase/thioredoxin
VTRRAILAGLFAAHLGASPAAAELANLVWLDPPEPAPEAGFADAARGARDLAGFRGRVLLVNFWATWCAPCRDEMPALDRLQARLGGVDFQVLAVAEDRGGLADVEPYFAELGIRHLAPYLDPGLGLARAFGVVGLPTTVLIDHRGMVVARMVGGADWDGADALATLQDLIAKARAERLDAASSAGCGCGGPKAYNVRMYGTVAPPP